jgi:hypothetical protein
MMLHRICSFETGLETWLRKVLRAMVVKLLALASSVDV